MAMSPRLLRPLASGFTPKNIPGLAVWYDIATFSSLTAATPPVVNGSAIHQVADISGNGRAATQTTGNNQPTYQSAGINSRPALSFDSNDSVLSDATIANLVGAGSSSPALTVAVVVASSPGTAGFAAGSDNAANGRLFFCLDFDNSGASFFDVAGTAGGRLSFSITAGQRAAAVWVFQRNGADMSVRRNGTVVASKNNASQTFTTQTAKFQIGQAVGLTGFASSASQVVCYPSALTATQVSSLEKYMATRAGITL